MTTYTIRRELWADVMAKKSKNQAARERLVAMKSDVFEALKLVSTPRIEAFFDLAVEECWYVSYAGKDPHTSSLFYLTHVTDQVVKKGLEIGGFIHLEAGDG